MSPLRLNYCTMILNFLASLRYIFVEQALHERYSTTDTFQTEAKLSTKPRLVFDMTSQEKLSDVEGVYDGEDVDVHVTSQTIPASHRGHHLDMVDRDPTKMNDHVRVFYQDVFAEPDGSHSIDGVWGASFSTFVSTKYWCYRILTAIFGIPTAILCGCYFACLSFDYIWCIMPCLRGYLIQLQCMGKVFGLFVRTFFDPFFDSLGRVFGGIKLTKVKKQEGGTFNA